MCSLLVYTSGNLAFGLFPVYAQRLGADEASSGNFMASIFVALVIGTMVGGWCSDRFQRRKAQTVIAAAISAVLFFLASQTQELIPLTILVDLESFFAGVVIATVSILTGLFAEDNERGKVFGIMAITLGLGTVFGNLASGPIADRWGFSALFVGSSLCWLLLAVFALLLEDKRVELVAPAQPTAKGVVQPVLGVAFYLLLIANTIAWAAISAGNFGRPLRMDDFGFDAAAISGAAAIGGIVSLPFPYFIGWLSDRIGRYRLIAGCFIASAVSLGILAASSDLWHFWLACILGAGIGISTGVASALVIDLIPRESLSAGLARFNATNWIGSIIGFAGAGYAIQIFGATASFIVSGIALVIAVGLLIVMQRVRRPALA